MNLPFVSIITVNYNGKKYLKECFSSLYKLNYPKNKLEIIMVDNGSEDNSVDYVDKYFPKVKIIKNDINNYCRANNLGIKIAKGDYIALINNDVKVDKNWLAALVKTAQNDFSVGAVGSKILFMDGTLQSVGHQEYPNFYWGDIGFRDKDANQYNLTKEVSSVCGCSVLYSRKCLKDVGLLDEDFNIFLEDVDMSIRCKEKGWKLVTCPESIIYHKFHSTISNEDNAKYWQETNRLLLIAKHWPEKLPDVLSGRDYFTEKNICRSERDISEVLGKVFVKLIKEHGLELTNRLSNDLFNAVHRIYNFEKSSLIYEIKEKEILIAKNEEQLSSLRQQMECEISAREEQLSSLRQQMECEISAREEQLSSLRQQMECEISAREEQLSSLRQQMDLLTQERQQYQRDLAAKGQELSLIKQNKDTEINYYKLNLQQVKSELNNIYFSSGYRYILRPLWGFLWPIKQKIKRTKANIKSILSSFKFKLKNKIKPSAPPKIKKILSKINEIYYCLPVRNKWINVYIAHIKYKTFPPKPERLTLMLNRVCNLKCIFCDIPNTDYKGVTLSKENAFRIIDSVKKIGIKEMILTGGEPFLHPSLFEIIDFANSGNISSIITTNGLFIRQHIGKIIKSCIGCISVSIDGNEKTHDSLRNRQGVYKQALDGIYLLKQNKVNTSVNFVVTNRNINELEDVYNFFSSLGIKVSFLPVINKPDLFPAKKEERNIYMKFIKKLLRKKLISVYDYKYLELAMSAYFSKNNVNVRCLGLNYELGIDTIGNISPCCVWENRKSQLNNLGNLLETDIEELWCSAKFHQVRTSIYNEGCQNCFNPSIADLPKITGISFLVPHTEKKNFIFKTEDLKKEIARPNHVHMRFTSRCNLTCRHCDIWKAKKDNESEISIEEWKSCIDKLHAWLGSFKLDLAGGEIFLYYGTIALIHYCVSRGVTVNLTTNATLIDEAMAEKIANSGLYCVNLSLDGLEDVHCYTRNDSNTFLKVQQAAQNLLKYRKQDIPYISLTTVITKYNLKQLPEIVKLTQKWNINNISFQALDQNFGSKYDPDWFKENEFWPEESSELESAIDNLINMKKKGIRIDNSFEQLNAFKRYYKNPAEEINNQCFSAVNNFIVNEFGEVLLCWNMPPVGGLLSDNPEKIWNSKSATQLRKQIERCKRTCRVLNCNYI